MNHFQTTSFYPAYGLAPDIADFFEDRINYKDSYCVVGDPPPREKHLHQPEFVNRFWERLINQIRNPLIIEHKNGVRKVQILGQALYTFDPNGLVKVDIWRIDQKRGAYLEPTSQNTVSILGVPFRMIWFAQFKIGFAFELARFLSKNPDDLNQYVDWVFMRFRKLIRSHCDLRVLRQKVAKGLSVNPFIIEVARRIRRTTNSKKFVSANDYNHIVVHLEAYKILWKEAPQLIPIYSIFVEEPDFPTGTEPTALLKKYLSSYGINSSMWRLIVNSSNRLILHAFDFYKGKASSAIYDYLVMLQLLKFRHQPPVWFMLNLMSLYAHPGNPRESFNRVIANNLNPLRRIAHLLELAVTDQQAVMKSDMQDVLSWAVDEQGGMTFDWETLKRAKWNWFLNKAQKWRTRQNKKISSGENSWDTPFTSISIGKYSIIAIDNPLGLWEEATAMRHCAEIFADRCFAGEVQIFSVRLDGNKRPVATIRAERLGDRYSLGDAVGFANQKLEPRLLALSNTVINIINKPYKKLRPTADQFVYFNSKKPSAIIPVQFLFHSGMNLFNQEKYYAVHLPPPTL